MNYLQNLSLDVCALIIEKTSPIDLQYLRSTCHELRNHLDDKVVIKVFNNLERTHRQLIYELDLAIVECQMKEDILEKKIQEEYEVLKEKAKSADIQSGDYDEERDGEYEFIMYDDDIEEEIYSPLSYLKGKKESKYKVKLLGETFEFWFEDLKKIKAKLDESKVLTYVPSTSHETLQIGFITQTQICDDCKSECNSIPHISFKSIMNLEYKKCYNCVLNNKRDFIVNLLKQDSLSKLHMYALNFNALRIMIGLGGLSYNINA